MRNIFRIAVFLICSLVIMGAAAPTPAEAKLQIESERLHKRAVVAQNMRFSKGEEQKFWPLYDKYQEALDKNVKRSVDLVNLYISNYQNLSNKKAKSMMDEALRVEREQLKIKTRYIRQFEAELSAKTVARYYQIENKIRTIKEFELVESIPLVR